jgi:hypothetical protein
MYIRRWTHCSGHARRGLARGDHAREVHAC